MLLAKSRSSSHRDIVLCNYIPILPPTGRLFACVYMLMKKLCVSITLLKVDSD